MINPSNSSYNNSDTSNRNIRRIILSFYDGRQIAYDSISLSEIASQFYSLHSTEDIITMPQWMVVEDLTSFITIFQKGNDYIGEYTDIIKLLKTSEFLENEAFSFSLLSEVIIPRLSIENSLSFLIIGYHKLSEVSRKNEDVDNIWYTFFIKCLDIVGKNLSYYFKKKKYDEIGIFDVKILDELYEKFSSHILSSNFMFTEDISMDTLRGNNILSSNLSEMISFLMKSRGQNNFFELLTNEYMKICSEDNISELNSSPNPTFLLKINSNELESYYEDYKLDISMNMKQVVFVVFYRKSDDSFNVSFKLIENNALHKMNYGELQQKMNSFRIVTFLSSVIVEEIAIRQINVKSISNDKSMHNIYKINNMKKLLTISGKEGESFYLTLKIYLKPCFIHSMMTSFLLYNLNNFYNEENISKLSKQLIVLILKNKNYTIIEENKIVIALLNWRKNDL